MSAVTRYRVNENQNRYTRRQEQRRKVDALVRSDCSEIDVCRRGLTSAEAEQLLKSVEDNKISEFGLVKLSVLNLNEAYSLGEDGEPLTLLQYATLRCRDKIALALIRAGALPYVENTSTAKACIRDIPAQYVVWLMKYEKLRATVDTCQICASPATRCVRFDGCDHIACSGCFWSHIHQLDSLPSESALMLSTGAVWVGILDPIVCCLVCCQQTCDHTHSAKQGALTASLLQMAPGECKRISYERYRLLPVAPGGTKDDTGTSSGSGSNAGKESGKDRAHRGMHPSELARCSLGNTQTQRDDELVKACMKGDLRRVAALVEAGVHLDGADEYGMTALMQAAWLGRVHVCALLLAAGADATLGDALEHTAPGIAQSAGHSDVVQLLVHSKVFNPHGELCCPVKQEGSALAMVTYTGLQNIRNGKGVPGLYSVFEQLHPLEQTELVLDEEYYDAEELKSPTVNILIPPVVLCEQAHVSAFWREHGVKGAEPGAFCFDNCFHPGFLQGLLDIHDSLAVAPSEKAHCASRSYFCDVEGRVTQCVERAIRAAASACQLWGPTETASARTVRVFPQMRFLHYEHAGTALAPHVDLARKDVRDVNVKSTHTLILYLTDCAVGGGETVLLKSLNCRSSKKASNDMYVEKGESATNIMDVEVEQGPGKNVVASISPRAGRLLLFPHNCPHEGRAINHIDPKLLLRGEVFISS